MTAFPITRTKLRGGRSPSAMARWLSRRCGPPRKQREPNQSQFSSNRSSERRGRDAELMSGRLLTAAQKRTLPDVRVGAKTRPAIKQEPRRPLHHFGANSIIIRWSRGMQQGWKTISEDKDLRDAGESNQEDRECSGVVNDSAEGVNDPHAFDLAAMGHVLGQ
jgi:hypothetical protein